MTTDDTAGEPKQISVAELLARNGQKGGVNATEGGRRRRGVPGGITVAELTGEIPVVRDEPAAEKPAPKQPEQPKAEPAAAAPASVSKPETPKVEQPKPEKPKAPVAPKAEAPKVEQPKPAPAKPETPKPKTETSKTEAPKTEAPKTEAPKVKPQPATAAWPAPAAPSLNLDAPAAPKPAEKPAEKPTAWSSQSEPQLLAGTPTSSDLIGRSEVPPEESTEVFDAAPPVERSWMTKRDEQKQPEADANKTDTTKADSTKADSTKAVFGNKIADRGESKSSNVRQWLMLLGQAVVAIVVGALLFKGFERLWDMLPWVALVLALLVILGLVALVRILRKTDDLLSIVIAIVVGVFVTMGPLVFLLSTS